MELVLRQIGHLVMSSGHSYGATDAGASQNLGQFPFHVTGELHFNITLTNKVTLTHTLVLKLNWYLRMVLCST